MLKGQAAESALSPIQFYDISGPDGTGPLQTERGIGLSDAMARMHVIDSDGQVRTGAEAFIAMWSCLPYWNWIAKLVAHYTSANLRHHASSTHSVTNSM